MFVNLEHNEKHSITSYTEQSITIQDHIYEQSCIISPNTIETHWPIQAIHELDQTLLKPLLQFNPKIILIGHNSINTFAPQVISEFLIQQNIALEVMPIGSACRTFNILLSEKRAVVLGIIL